MQNNILGSCGIGIKIETKGLAFDRLWNDILQNKLLYRFIPNFSTDGEFVSTLQVINSIGTRDVELNKIGSSISGVYEKDFDSTDVIVLVEYLLERFRQEKGIYTIHSSSLYKGERGLLLIANLTGAGKTSVGLSLQEKDGFKLFSDEKTLMNIQNNALVGQVEKIYLETKTVKALNEEGIDLPKEISITKADNKQLSLIIVPIVVPGMKSPIIRQYEPSQLKWILYEEFSKDIRLVNGMVFNMTTPLMSLDTPEIAQKRLDEVSEVSKNIPAYLIQGSLPQISEEINKLF